MSFYMQQHPIITLIKILWHLPYVTMEVGCILPHTCASRYMIQACTMGRTRRFLFEPQAFLWYLWMKGCTEMLMVVADQIIAWLAHWAASNRSHMIPSCTPYLLCAENPDQHFRWMGNSYVIMLLTCLNCYSVH